MKAIIKVNKNSSYANLNGLTFDVNMIVGRKLLNISTDGLTTADFSIKEVMIVDIQNELQHAFDNNNFHGGFRNSDTLAFLQNYISENNIQVEEPQYNCPA